MPKWVWDILLAMFLQASPEIKKMLCQKLDELAVEAKKTSNPFDDLLIKITKGMVGCKSE